MFALRVSLGALLVALSVPLALGQPTDTRTLRPRQATAETTPATAERRVAFVIGNQSYQRIAQLVNPVNDATALRDRLRSLGFDVVYRANATRAQIETGVREFRSRLSDADVGLFFYAGHGVQVQGSNFLIPVEADIASESEVPYKAVNLDYVLGQMEEAGVPFKLVILDACRDNPFASRSMTGRGISSASSTPRGTLIAFATSPGQTASDNRRSSNGLYTSALLQEISTPAIDVREMLERVAVRVEQESGGQQVPWTATSARGRFYFVPVSGQSLVVREPATDIQPDGVNATAPVPAVAVAPSMMEEADRLMRSGNIIGAVGLYQQGAAVGDAQAQYTLGVLYSEGRGVIPRDTLEGARLLRQAADNGSVPAQARLGEMLLDGRGIARDALQGGRFIQMAAEASDAAAMTRLAEMYVEGRLVERNVVRAGELLNRAAASNHPAAIYRLGMMYAREGLMGNDPARMQRAVAQAAQLGYGPALHRLAVMSFEGNGVARDSAAGLRQLQAAVEAGDAEALALMGTFLLNGQGVTRNVAQAADLLGRAARHGIPSAHYPLGLIAERGLMGPPSVAEAATHYRAAQARVPAAAYQLAKLMRTGALGHRDAAGAVRLLEQAVQQGYAPAQTELGVVYEEGDGVARDFQRALRFYQQAQASGDAYAMYRLARLHLQGRGVAQDTAAALALMRSASQAGDATAMYWLAQAQEHGWHMDADLSRSMNLYRQAAAQGSPDAHGRIGAYLVSSCLRYCDDTAAAEHLALAAAANVNDASRWYAQVLTRGRGVQRDVPRAEALLRGAAQRGDSQASLALAELLAFETPPQASGKEEAVRIARQAAESQDPEGMYLLGRMSLEGIGLPKDVNAGVDLLSRASVAGHLEATWMLAQIYDQRRVGEQAMMLYRRGSVRGDVRASHRLGEFYQRGDYGVRRNSITARRYYSLAVEQGYPDAMVALAQMMEAGEGEAADPEQARSLLGRAAELGHPEARERVGYVATPISRPMPTLPTPATQTGTVPMSASPQPSGATPAAPGTETSMSGAGRPSSSTVASPPASPPAISAPDPTPPPASSPTTEPVAPPVASTPEQAAESGDMFAQYTLGMMHANGDGRPQDGALAARWLGQASERGYAPSQFALSIIYDEGKIVAQNLPESIRLLRLAADQQLAAAVYTLGRRYATGRGVETNFPEAARLYQRAGEAGYVEGYYRLGLLYETGSGVARDVVHARTLYQQAAQAGHAESRRRLDLLQNQ